MQSLRGLFEIKIRVGWFERGWRFKSARHSSFIRAT
jgi:hypothetical protein